MKLLFTFCFVLLFAWLISDTKKTPSFIDQEKINLKKDTIQFTSDIEPILVKNCSPCHFPGGKMYARLPFDKDTTIINHQAGVLRRIKGEENSIMKAFIQQNTRDDN